MTTTVATDQATICFPEASSRSISTPASASGTSRPSITTFGTWDLPAAPILADITVDGQEIKAVILPTKQSYMFVLNRETGQPVWPIEEVPVERGDVPGEWYSPTQPIPTKPPPVDRVEFGRDDLVDYTPALRAEAEEILSPVQARHALHTTDRGYGRRPAWPAPGPQLHWGRELAGRIPRPRDRRRSTSTRRRSPESSG